MCVAHSVVDFSGKYLHPLLDINWFQSQNVHPEPCEPQSWITGSLAELAGTSPPPFLAPLAHRSSQQIKFITASNYN